MRNLIINSLLVAWSIEAALAQTEFSTTPLEPANLDCKVNGVDVLTIPEGDVFLITDWPIYDNIKESSVIIPFEGKFALGGDISSIAVESNKYVSIYSSSISSSSPYVSFRVYAINEEIEISQPTDHFYYNFTLLVGCNGNISRVFSVIPIHETNTYTPVFSKTVYEYSLFSSTQEDLDRLLDLNPIVANDNDMSNTEVIFSIESNQYFDLQYNGVVPGSLNKNHYARLVPKSGSINLSKNLEVRITVTDLGYPRKSSNATLIINPSNMMVPTFKQAYYIGDYYANHTFVMRSQPQLSTPPTSYDIYSNLIAGTYTGYVITSYAYKNGTIEISRNQILPELAIYKYNYMAFTLQVTYTDRSLNDYSTKGNCTVILELHH